MTSKVNSNEKDNTWIIHSAAGAFSGVFTRLVSQPFDVIKIRFQVI